MSGCDAVWDESHLEGRKVGGVGLLARALRPNRGGASQTVSCINCGGHWAFRRYLRRLDRTRISSTFRDHSARAQNCARSREMLLLTVLRAKVPCWLGLSPGKALDCPRRCPSTPFSTAPPGGEERSPQESGLSAPGGGGGRPLDPNPPRKTNPAGLIGCQCGGTGHSVPTSDQPSELPSTPWVAWRVSFFFFEGGVPTFDCVPLRPTT